MADQKITQLTEETAPVSSDLTVIVDDPSGSPTTKKTTLANLSKGIVAANMPDFLDEDDMNSDSASSVASQRSIKAYVDNLPQGYGGWLTEGLDGVTVTRESTDDPTVVLRFDADVRDYIWKGMRIKATENSIVHYFIVSADPTDDSGDTLVTCLSEIDTSTPTQAKNLIGTGTISDVAYAPPKTYPKGFPISPESWTVKLVNSSDNYQSSPSLNTWYNPGSISLSIPIGDWDTEYSFALFIEDDNSSFMTGRATLSTANNTESNSQFTSVGGGSSGGSSSYLVRTAVFKRFPLAITSKTTHYLNAQVQFSGASNVGFAGSSRQPTVIRATSTLL